MKLDRRYINQSEGCEIRDFLFRYYEKGNLEDKPENYEISLKKIMEYQSGRKVETQELLDYLASKQKIGKPLKRSLNSPPPVAGRSYLAPVSYALYAHVSRLRFSVKKAIKEPE